MSVTRFQASTPWAWALSWSSYVARYILATNPSSFLAFVSHVWMKILTLSLVLTTIVFVTSASFLSPKIINSHYLYCTNVWIDYIQQLPRDCMVWQLSPISPMTRNEMLQEEGQYLSSVMIFIIWHPGCLIFMRISWRKFCKKIANRKLPMVKKSSFDGTVLISENDIEVVLLFTRFVLLCNVWYRTSANTFFI